MNRIDMRRIAEVVLADAKQKSLNAAMGGSMSDGGAAALEQQVECFLAGMEGRIPAGWQLYAEHNAIQVNAERDPDFEAAKRFAERNPEFFTKRR